MGVIFPPNPALAGEGRVGMVIATHTKNVSLLKLPILLPDCSLAFGCLLSHTSNSHWIYPPPHDAGMRVFAKLFCHSRPESDHVLCPNFLCLPTIELLHKLIMQRKVIHLEKTF